MTDENRPEIDIYAAMAEGRRLHSHAFRDAWAMIAEGVKRVFAAAGERAEARRTDVSRASEV